MIKSANQRELATVCRERHRHRSVNSSEINQSGARFSVAANQSVDNKVAVVHELTKVATVVGLLGFTLESCNSVLEPLPNETAD